MAHAVTTADYPRESIAARSAEWLSRTFHSIAEANPRLQSVRWLQGRSDAELAALNIRRGEIVHHVFRDAYYR